MRYVHLAGSGARISVIGVGAWQFGSRDWGYGESYAQVEAGRIVQRALDLGINLVDTAEAYAFGRSERIVGRAIAVRRKEVFVASKIFPVLPVAPVVVRRGRASARRLGVATIDLYQIHQPNPVVPLSSQMEGMRRLVAAGLVGHVGVSNFSLSRWQAAELAFGRPVVSNQVSFSLAERRPLEHLVPWAAAHDRLIIAYSPLAQGLLSARYDAGNAPRRGVRALNPLFLPENLARAEGLLTTLRDIASAHDATPAQVALAWVTRWPNVVAIPGASSVEQLELNAAAADLDLSEDEHSRLTAAAEQFQPVRGTSTIVELLRRRFRS
ncbi:MAG TPA: aldo/keto reductase [Acidimicrobiales bacterium]|nr:aldo/keto reductase [Acidimicrobiales bacterium]